MEILTILIIVFLFLSPLGFWLLIRLGKLDKLERAIYLADKVSGFTKKINELGTYNHSSFLGVDPYDIASTIEMAKMRGGASIDKEIKKYGNIKEL